ncbi:MAG: outer membrane beta-barrel protein [Alphaproteobacteria bacterium]|nr:outer membrane beta-barrel protein [Alphaproteobacteria bacterium]MDD9920647.1 outer membrane beta-barrel protein [Alphaproteobacteria bacterium]
MRTFGMFVCTASLIAGTASAEIYGYQVLGKKLELTRPDQADAVTSVYNYPREDYRPDGTRVGSFDVYATAKADVAYNDNIYATETATESDVITKITPALVAKSDWGRHELVGRVHGELVRYLDNSDEDYENYGVNVSGRLDVKRNSYAFASIGADVKHEDRGSPNAVSAAKEPTEYLESQGQIGYVHAQGRMSMSAFADVTKLDFEDGQTSTGTNIDQDGRDRTEKALTVQVGYEIKPEYEAFVRGTFKNIEYDQTTSQDRNSDASQVVAGLATDLTGKVRGEIYAGYLRQDYSVSSTYKKIAKPTYGANMLWSVDGLTSVSVDANRTVGETTVTGASGYLSTGLNVGVQHELRRNVLLSGNAGYANHDYIGHAITREDDYINAGAEVRYLLNKNYSVGLRYDYTNRDSNQAGADYDRNTIMATLTGSL